MLALAFWVVMFMIAPLAADMLLRTFSPWYDGFKTRHRRGGLAMLLAALVVMGVVAVLTSPFGGGADAEIGPTAVEIVAVDRFVTLQPAADLTVDCVERAGGSLRADRSGTLTCFTTAIDPTGATLGGVVRDPCFPLDTFSVVCSDGRGQFERLRVFGLPARSPLAAPTAGAWPWGLELSDGTFCIWALAHEAEANRAGTVPEYTCDGSAVYVATVTNTSSSDEQANYISLDAIVPMTNVSIQATNLVKVSDSDWTVEFSPDGASFRTVTVRTVWF